MKWFLVSLYAISVCHIHFRGRVRLPVLRQVFDHSSFMAPVNMFLHWFSGVPHQPYLSLNSFPDAGSLRYHLGLVTPKSERCFIEVDGQRYSWHDGKAVVFDETYIHWARNDSTSSRIILFCDIERPMRYRWAQAVNRWLGRTMMTAASSPNETGDQTGGVNKLFYLSWYAGQYRRRFKAWNRTVYQLTKAALILGAAAAIIYI